MAGRVLRAWFVAGALLAGPFLAALTNEQYQDELAKRKAQRGTTPTSNQQN